MLHFKSFSPKWGISPNLHSLSVATLGNKTSPMNIRSDCPLQSQVHLIGLLRIYKNKVNRPIYFYLSWQLLGTHLPHDLHSPPPPHCLHGRDPSIVCNRYTIQFTNGHHCRNMGRGLGDIRGNTRVPMSTSNPLLSRCLLEPPHLFTIT